MQFFSTGSNGTLTLSPGVGFLVNYGPLFGYLHGFYKAGSPWQFFSGLNIWVVLYIRSLSRSPI